MPCTSSSSTASVWPIDVRERQFLAQLVALQISHPAQRTSQQFTHAFVTLGEDLKDVPVGSAHDVAHAGDELGTSS